MAHAKYRMAVAREASWKKTQVPEASAAELANDFRACHWANSPNPHCVVMRFRGNWDFAKVRGRSCIDVQSNHSAVPYVAI